MGLTKTVLSQRDEWRGVENLCIKCGKFHASQDHWQFMESMPSDPLDMISDLTKMGVYKPQTFDIADALSSAELRKELFLKMAGKGSPPSVKN